MGIQVQLVSLSSHPTIHLKIHVKKQDPDTDENEPEHKGLLFQPVFGPPVWKSVCFLQQVFQEVPKVEQIGVLIR